MYAGERRDLRLRRLMPRQRREFVRVQCLKHGFEPSRMLRMARRYYMADAGLMRNERGLHGLTSDKFEIVHGSGWQIVFQGHAVRRRPRRLEIADRAHIGI